ncbi:hypothetical protein [Rugosimonospora africana]|nr:hypothetical protein [Rugosimonospora africana]
MSALERRYRRLIGLLPADHRAARGEELLGMLLDLDDGRGRPSFRQASGVLGLAVRLRLARLSGLGSLVVTALLVALATDQVMALTNLLFPPPGVVAMSPSVSHLLHHDLLSLLGFPLAWLGVTVAWVLGARRTALAGYTALVAYQVLSSFLPPVAAVTGPVYQLPVLAAMAVATRWRWPVRRPRGTVLATLPLGVLLWWLIGVWGRHGIVYPALNPAVLWAAASAGVAVALVATRRRRLPARLAWAATGLVAGALVPELLVRAAFGAYGGWMLPVAAVTAAFAWGVSRTRRRLVTD